MEKETIKLKNIIEKYGEFEINEEELKKILVEPKPKTIWDLKPGDKYFVLHPDGAIIDYTWANDNIDKSIIYLGSVFLTRDEAEFELGRRKVETELLKYGGTRDMMSLGNGDIYKYYIFYHYLQDKVYIESLCCTHYLGRIYFKSKEECQKAIDSIGKDRIKKYLFYTD